MENIIINGKESQLPFGKWFLEEMEEQTDDDMVFETLEEVYFYFTEEEVEQMAKDYFEEMYYTFEKIENGMIYVTCEDDD